MIFLLLSMGCHAPHVAAAPEVVAAHAPAGRVVIAHTNDLHQHFLPNSAEWLTDRPELGGFVAIDAQLRALRQANGDDAVLYLDAGDLLTGTPLMEFQEHGAYGGAILDFLEQADCEAWALGNHELDRGYDNAAALVANSPMPVLSANLRDPEDPTRPAFPGMEDHRIIEVNGLKIGVFGLTTPTLGRLASPETMAHIQVLQPADVAREQVAELEPQVDLIVALSHDGLESDRHLAEDVDGIDLIVGGHSHSRVVTPEHVGDTWIVQTGAYARELGVVELDVSRDGRPTHVNGHLIELYPDQLPLPPDPDMVALSDKWAGAIYERFQQVVGTSTGPMTRAGSGETVLGRWAADVVRSAGWADVGLYNGSGVRGDLPGGDVTLGALYEVFPFANQVVSFEVTGEQLVSLMIKTAHAEQFGKRAPLQWSGVHFQWKLVMGAPEIVEATVAGQPLELDRRYRLATNSYVAEQWEYNLGFEPRDLKPHGMTVLQAAEATLRAGTVVPPTDLRSEPVQ